MQFKWKLIVFTGLMTQLFTYAHAQQAAPPQETIRFSAEDAVAYALTNQYAVRNAKLDELKQLAINKEVSGTALPQVSGAGKFDHSPILRRQLIDVGGFSPDPAAKGQLQAVAFGLPFNVDGSLNVNQVLFDPSVLVALQARETLEMLARKGVAKSEIDVKTEVYKAYYNVLAADKAMTILQENIDRLGKSLEETREIYKNGLVEKLDVDRLVVQYNNLKAEDIRLRNIREVGIAALKYQMGMPLNQKLELKDTLSDAALKASIQDEQSFAYNNRIEYQLLQVQKDANMYNLKRYRLQALPSLSLFGQGGALTGRTKFDLFQRGSWYGYVTYGLNLSVPIFSGMQRRRKVDQAAIEVERSDLALENMRNTIDLDQATATSNLRNNIATLKSQEENMELAKEVYETSNIKYREGVGSSLELITAETQLLTAQNGYFTALFNVIVSRIDYLKAYGKL